MITYKKAGVDIDAGNALVKMIKKSAPWIGGFSGFVELPNGHKKPVLVGTTDGVGTKLKIAQALGVHDTIGIDLVAMNVNDLICVGAKPLFFLDYFATGKLDVSVAHKVIQGIFKGCKMAGCRLLGGETAEMPGMYKPGEYDLAGFAVGIADKSKVLNGRGARPGDVLIGLPSSGIHSNGYSLVRKLFKPAEVRRLRKVLLAPTIIYVKKNPEAPVPSRAQGFRERDRAHHRRRLPGQHPPRHPQRFSSPREKTQLAETRDIQHHPETLRSPR